jgi:hypothetical protein
VGLDGDAHTLFPFYEPLLHWALAGWDVSEALSSWIERVRRLVAYHEEARAFVERVRQQFPLAHPQHTPAVARLWLVADEVDPFLCTLLEEVNRSLLGGKGEVDTTRGAQVRREALPWGQGLEGLPGVSPRETMSYDCTWSLRWAQERGVLIRLTVEPEGEVYGGTVVARRARHSRDIPCPVRPGDRSRFEEAVREAVMECFAAEATGVPAPDTPPPASPHPRRRKGKGKSPPGGI